MNFEKKHTCSYCERKFSRKDSMQRHVRLIHGQKPQMSNHRFKCPDIKCLENTHSILALRKHIIEEHGISLEVEEHNFLTIEDFNIWKDQMEKVSFCSYIQHRSAYISSSGDKVYHFMCHRSGFFKSKSTGQRSMKGLGTKKINSFCPATVDVVISKDTGHVKVTHHKTHFGHVQKIGHMFLTKHERKEIAGKIREGVSFSRILDEIRDTSENFARIHLTMKKDLNNIMREFNVLQNEKLHEDDAISVKLWVESLSKLSNTPIIFYKEQGKKDEKNMLNEIDFQLIIMSVFQMQMLQLFGKDKICIDSTHGTNAYNFSLTSLLTVDEFGSGFPVAFCISNRIDMVAMTVFFDTIKEKVGTINCNVFMSDDAPAYYNAWEQVMGAPSHQLLCSWHVDRNWRKNLSKIQGTATEKAAIYKILRVLMQEIDSIKFEQMHENFLQHLLMEDKTRLFGVYFKEQYSKRTEVWAYYARVHLGINTNMYLESMHKVLKHFYLEGKKVKRVDKLLSILLKYNRDKLFERMSKILKNVPTTKSKKIRSSHHNSLKITQSQIKSKDIDTWEVSSENSRQSYIVKKNSQPLCIACHLKCKECNICVHMYSCSCKDNLIMFNICKHIHACHRLFNTIQIDSVADNDDIKDLKIEEFFDRYCKTDSAKSSKDEFEKVIRKVRLFESQLTENNLSENSSKINYHIDQLIILTNSASDNFKPTDESVGEPSNKKIKLQQRFRSTKKKRETKTELSLSKPLPEESLIIAEGLINPAQEILFAHSGFDHVY